MTIDAQSSGATQMLDDEDDWFLKLLRAPSGAVMTQVDTVASTDATASPHVEPPLVPPTSEQAQSVLSADVGATIGAVSTTEVDVDTVTADELTKSDVGEPVEDESILPISPNAISPNPTQPRRSFDEDELQALADSIGTQGVIQPVIVRRVSTQPDHFQLVAGERRWRAAQIAGLDVIPAIVRSLDDRRVAEFALVENIQRADLPALEEAQAFQQLLDRHGYTQDELARRVGKSRSHVAHLLRLLRLPPSVQHLIQTGHISVGHARLLVNAADPIALAKRIIADGLTVRQTENALKSERPSSNPISSPPEARPEIDLWANRLGEALERPVALKPGRKGGSVVIRYDTEDDLAAILAKIT